MDDNRIRVRLQPELTPARLEDKMDVNAEIDVGVETHLKGLGVFGAVLATVGALAMVVAATMFAFGYPTPWVHDINDDGANAFVKGVILTAVTGIVLLFVGTSAFFYGRTVLGSGQVDQFATHEVLVGQGGA
jgi:hypothetical protein